MHNNIYSFTNITWHVSIFSVSYTKTYYMSKSPTAVMTTTTITMMIMMMTRATTNFKQLRRHHPRRQHRSPAWFGGYVESRPVWLSSSLPLSLLKTVCSSYSRLDDNMGHASNLYNFRRGPWARQGHRPDSSPLRAGLPGPREILVERYIRFIVFGQKR